MKKEDTKITFTLDKADVNTAIREFVIHNGGDIPEDGIWSVKPEFRVTTHPDGQYSGVPIYEFKEVKVVISYK